jgi:hypothetical protein
VALALPVKPPKHFTFTVPVDTFKAEAGCVTVAMAVPLQPFMSFTVRV